MKCIIELKGWWRAPIYSCLPEQKDQVGTAGETKQISLNNGLAFIAFICYIISITTCDFTMEMELRRL